MKTITKRQFRVLLTLSIVALLLSVTAAFLDPLLLPKPLLDYQQSQRGVRPSNSAIVVSLLGGPGVIVGIFGIVGLYRFWPIAPKLSVASWAYMTFWMCFSPGPVLENPVSASLSNCSTFLVGAVLTLAFFSPAADWFHKEA